MEKLRKQAKLLSMKANDESDPKKAMYLRMKAKKLYAQAKSIEEAEDRFNETTSLFD